MCKFARRIQNPGDSAAVLIAQYCVLSLVSERFVVLSGFHNGSIGLVQSAGRSSSYCYDIVANERLAVGSVSVCARKPGRISSAQKSDNSRFQLGLTQNELSARICVLGWDISRATLSHIEAQLRCVTDYELVCLARALRVTAETVLPASTAIKRAITDFFPEKPSDDR